MKVVLVSNYYNHHQAPFSKEMNKLTEGNFFFIENEEIEKERKDMGWGEAEIPNFVKRAYLTEEGKKECITCINNADVVLFENTTRSLVEERLKLGKLTFLYSERVFKSGYEWWKLPIRWYTWHRVYDRYKNHYLLCASAYTSADFALTFNYINKAYKWGYFPLVQKYDIEKLMKKKVSMSTEKLKYPYVSIVWAGRLIQWKHPEVIIDLAEQLKNKQYDFKISIIGNGPMERILYNMIREKKLEKTVELLGSMSPDSVRTYMEQADIYLFTSDFNEGWGAVLNESMNSGCAVVASHAIGSVPFLIQDGKNGLIYENGNQKDLIAKVEQLMESKELRRKLGVAAYKSMNEVWNAEIAAERLLKLANDLLEKGESNRYVDGPCSKAHILKNRWFKA